MKICHENLLACNLINKIQYKTKSLNWLEVYRRHKLLNKNQYPVLPHLLLIRASKRNKKKQNIAVALDYTNLLNGKTLLLKIPLTLVARIINWPQNHLPHG